MEKLRLVGGHVSTSGGLVKALGRGDAIGAEVIQIFSNSPRGWKAQRISLGEFESISAARQSSGTGVCRVLSHASYLINLATPDPDLYEKSVRLLCETMSFGGEIGVCSVVLHVGSHRGAGFKSQLGQILAAIEMALLASSDIKLLVENSAGAGDSIGSSLEEIAEILRGVDGGNRLGVCLDTQHLFAAGFAFNGAKEAQKIGDALDSTLGAASIRCVHLNDSKVKLGSRVDRHENLGEGEIGLDALGHLLAQSVLESADIILECPGDGDGPRLQDVEVARSLLCGQKTSPT